MSAPSPDKSTPRNSRFVTVLFLAVFLGISLLLVHLLSVFLAAIVLAAVLVSLSNPVLERLLKLTGGRRRLAAGATTGLVVFLVALPLSVVLTSLTTEAVDLYDLIRSGDESVWNSVLASVDPQGTLVVTVRTWGERAGIDLSPEGLREYATTAGTALASFLVQELRGVASGTLWTLMHFGLMVIVMFSLFVDGPRLKSYLLDLSPLPNDQEERLVSSFASISRAVFLGNGVASVLQGVCGGLGFYFFGIGSAVLWGAAIAFFAFLPIVGATIVFVPAAIYLAATGEMAMAVGFVVYNMIYVTVLEYGMKPRLIGAESHMSGVLIFLGILAGLNLFGILGLFYGPLILTLFLTVAEIYKEDYRDDLTALRSPWMSSDLAASTSHADPADDTSMSS